MKKINFLFLQASKLQYFIFIMRTTMSFTCPLVSARIDIFNVNKTSLDLPPCKYATLF